VRQKGFTPIIILIFIAILIGIGYFATRKGYVTINLLKPTASNNPVSTGNPSSTPDPTANWKTYERYNISFKYPETWYTEEFDGGIELIHNADENVSLLLVKSPWGFDGQCFIKVGTTQNLSISGLNIEKEIFDPVSDKTREDCQQTTTRNQRIIWLTWNENGSIYRLSYSFESSQKDKYESILDNILSTLKFTK